VDEAVHIEREVPGVGLITFDDQPIGSPTLKGTPRLRARRCYHLESPDGVRCELPSVTTILSKVVPKPSLLRWYEAQGAEVAVALERVGALQGIPPAECVTTLRGLGYGAEAVAKLSAGRGTAIHTILERFLRYGEMPELSNYPQDWHGFIFALMRFLSTYHVVPDEDGIERLVAHPELGYAGRLDARVHIDNVSALLDLKTNTRGSVYAEHHLQTIAYAMADAACGASPPASILILALGHDGRYEIHESQGTPAMWRSVMSIYRHQQGLIEAIRKSAPTRIVSEAVAA
jgi:hypothetical protein